ncbi:MAG: DedA family protein [Pseudomonadota bacterium]
MYESLPLLDSLILLLSTHSELFIYLALFFVLILAGIGLPIPEEVTLVGGGFLAYGGFSDLMISLIVCFAGVLVGDVIVYTLGRRWGNDIIKHRYLVGFITERRLNRARKFFRDHGNKTIFIARFLSGFRLVIWATAGILRMGMARFLSIDSLAAAISVPTLVLIGYIFGANIRHVIEVVRKTDVLIIASVLFAAGVFLAYRVWKRKKRS